MTRPLILGAFALLLTGCTPEGYPSNDTEMWGVVIIFLGLFALLAWLAWLDINSD